MAKKKKEMEGPPPPAAWMNTFSDLMNLLLCFFVLLFSMSTVDAEKFEKLAASFSSSISILPNGASAIGDGILVSNGVSQLNELSEYFSNMGLTSDGDQDNELKAMKEAIEQEELKQSEKMAEEIKEDLSRDDMTSDIEVDFTSQYVVLRLNGALLFDSGRAEIRNESMEFMSKIGDILKNYEGNLIEIVGHTDTVPVGSGSRYKDNTELSCFRALSVASYLQNEKGISPLNLQPSGRGEFVPIASNETAEGRAQNRRVEIKIHRELN